MRRIVAVSMTVAAMAAATVALAQTYTTAAEVKPILTATKPSWIAVREFDGQDLLYFTNLLAWRCGVSTIAYGLNGAPAETPFAMEPCYEGEAVPNALKAEDNAFLFLTQPLGSIATVSLLVTYDDGSTDTADYERKAVLMP
ncbi:hypothetical protein [Tabrizicola oligotrophica]|nr:hypothetical protein [Tabrizicola oligotrophica]